MLSIRLPEGHAAARAARGSGSHLTPASFSQADQSAPMESTRMSQKTGGQSGAMAITVWSVTMELSIVTWLGKKIQQETIRIT